MNLNKLMKQAQKMKDDLAKTQAELADRTVEVTAGGGKITVVANGAGSEMRQSLGTAVFAGMLGVTAFGLLFTPAFYTFVRKIGGGKLHKDHVAPKSDA